MVGDKTDDKCCIKGCRQPSAVIYLRRGLCDKHWNQLSALSVDETRAAVGLKPLKKKDSQPEPPETQSEKETENGEPQQEPVVGVA